MDNQIRYRRTQSVNKAEEIISKKHKERISQPDKPCHQPRDSLFSWSSEFDNFTGLINWAFLLLNINGFRLCLENLLKYGIRIDPMQCYNLISGKNGVRDYLSTVLIIYSLVPITVSLFLEKGLSAKFIAENVGIGLQVVNIIALVIVPIVVITIKENAITLFGATMVCTLYAILFMKIWSYVQVNMWCRRNLQQKPAMKNESNNSTDELENITTTASSTTNSINYPENLNLKNIMYFIWAPTLCYELNFPRTTSIRKRFVLKRCLELIVGINVVMALFQQWIIPAVQSSFVPFSNMDIPNIIERLLKLAVPNHLVWLCFFYLIFHSFLNLLGEILYFADRNFYNDWWNSNNINTFWKTWNMPVHRWCVRHLYIPVIQMGFSVRVASVTVFFISAFFHEYLVSVPLNTIKIWSFMGMMAQIPLAVISRFMERNVGSRWGNIVVWSTIILGQPLAIMMYYHDYAITHFNSTDL